jgi:hypothetical protein
MVELMVKCKRCLEIIPTGICMNIKSFKGSKIGQQKVVCPNCNAVIIWNKENVLDIS